MLKVHIASADVKIVQAAMQPLLTVIQTLRLKDASKCIAMAEDEGYALKNKKNIQGFMSREAKVYLVGIELWPTLVR